MIQYGHFLCPSAEMKIHLDNASKKFIQISWLEVLPGCLLSAELQEVSFGIASEENVCAAANWLGHLTFKNFSF